MKAPATCKMVAFLGSLQKLRILGVEVEKCSGMPEDNSVIFSNSLIDQHNIIQYIRLFDHALKFEGEVDNLPRLRGREKSSGECGVCSWASLGASTLRKPY